MSKILVVGGSGFIGSYLIPLLEADNCDLKQGMDFIKGVNKKYKTLIFLACDQSNTHAAYNYNIRLYEALDRYRVKYPKTHLIYISSAAVYYYSSIYGQTKRLGEDYASRFTKYTILRLSNVYGHGDGHGAPDKFLRGEKNIHGDGLQIRDLISVERVVSTIVGMTHSPEFGVFNVSSGIGVTVNEMFEMFGEGKPKHDKDIARNMGVRHSVLRPGRVL